MKEIAFVRLFGFSKVFSHSPFTRVALVANVTWGQLVPSNEVRGVNSGCTPSPEVSVILFHGQEFVHSAMFLSTYLAPALG